MTSCISKRHEKNVFTITWKIENFSFYDVKEGSVLRTPEFSVDILQETKWELWLFPVSTAFKDHMACYLRWDGLAVLDFEGELSFIDNNGSCIKSEIFSGCVFKKGKCSHPPLTAKRDEVFTRKKDEFLSQDILTVRFVIRSDKKFWYKIKECFIRTRIRVECTAFIGVVEKFNDPFVRKAVCIKPLSTKDLPISVCMHITENEIIYIELILLEYMNLKVCKCKLFLLDAFGKEVAFGQNEFSYFNRNPQIGWKIPFPLSKMNLINLREKYLPNNTLTFQCHIAFSTGIEYNKIEETRFFSGNDQGAVSNELVETDKCRSDVCFLWKDNLNSLQNDGILHGVSVSSNTKEYMEHTQIDTSKYIINLSKTSQGAMIQNTINSSPGNKLSDCSLSWKNDLMSLYKNQILCDVELLTKTKAIPAHSLILSIRSPVFSDIIATIVRMNGNNCASSTPLKINLQDLDEDTVEQMLMFLYTDSIDGMGWRRVKKLYLAADKYEIVAMKEKCSFLLLQNIQPINCCEILLLADKHQDKHMKKEVQLYIAQHNEEIVDGDQWRNLEKTNPFLALETLHTIILHYRKAS
ncbi:uncharacterized protein LOC129988575 [Argiope bruennichi]|nr:uncharacterized protein LOC129988575 [Argiope bruennichi]